MGPSLRRVGTGAGGRGWSSRAGVGRVGGACPPAGACRPLHAPHLRPALEGEAPAQVARQATGLHQRCLNGNCA